MIAASTGCENGKIKPVRVLGRRSAGERKGEIDPFL